MRRKLATLSFLISLLLNGNPIQWLHLTTWDHQRLLVDKSLRLVLVNYCGGRGLVGTSEANAKSHTGAYADNDANDDGDDNTHRKRCSGAEVAVAREQGLVRRAVGCVVLANVGSCAPRAVVGCGVDLCARAARVVRAAASGIGVDIRDEEQHDGGDEKLHIYSLFRFFEVQN